MVEEFEHEHGAPDRCPAALIECLVQKRQPKLGRFDLQQPALVCRVQLEIESAREPWLAQRWRRAQVGERSVAVLTSARREARQSSEHVVVVGLGQRGDDRTRQLLVFEAAEHLGDQVGPTRGGANGGEPYLVHRIIDQSAQHRAVVRVGRGVLQDMRHRSATRWIVRRDELRDDL